MGALNCSPYISHLLNFGNFRRVTTVPMTKTQIVELVMLQMNQSMWIRAIVIGTQFISLYLFMTY